MTAEFIVELLSLTARALSDEPVMIQTEVEALRAKHHVALSYDEVEGIADHIYRLAEDSQNELTK